MADLSKIVTQRVLAHLDKIRVDMGADNVPYTMSVPLALILLGFVIFAVLQILKSADEEPLTDAKGRRYKLVSIPGDGNCGFHAVAAGLNALQESGTEVDVDLDFSEGDIRKLLKKEAESAPGYYSEKLKEFGFEEAELEAFLKTTMEGGMDGHWLGAQFGEVELMMIARAMGLRIEMFVSEHNAVRCYQTHDFGKNSVGLLYSGSADRGHFDLLLEV
mmetsp:Transcript_8817/g.12871  ORF Transcript_8817/g.12871 Transcript_8817/m.12871 type:complete len:218 (-) Transcript_8817:135-788(-)